MNLFKENIIQVPLNKKNMWPQSANELYRPNNRRLSEKSVLTSADRRRQRPVALFSAF
jgi:hypothetical protein